MTPTGRFRAGRVYSSRSGARERVHDDRTSRFDCVCALSRRAEQSCSSAICWLAGGTVFAFVLLGAVTGNAESVLRKGKTLNWQIILAVALGGSLGSVARYLVGIGSGKLFGVNFPWGTLIINVTGSALIGVFTGLFALKWNLAQAMRIFLTVGICGGYTTFSTFSLDAFYLMERGEMLAAGAYMVGSVVLSVGALIVAMQAVRVLT
jgi:fluoride exporter